MNHNYIFVRCLQSRSPQSHQLRQLLRNKRLLAEVAQVSGESTRRDINQNSFVLRGKLDVRKDNLYEGILGAVEHYVDAAAADSICGVRFLSANLVQVKCLDINQCQRIIRRRLAFSSMDNTPHDSAAVRRVLQARLFVDNYCTHRNSCESGPACGRCSRS